MTLRRYIAAFALSASLSLRTLFVSVAVFARDVVEIAFPATVPRELIETVPAPVRVQGLPSLRAFRDSVLSRLGDGRERSPLSVAFVT